MEVDEASPGPSRAPESLTADTDTSGVSSRQAKDDEPASVDATLRNETCDATCSERHGWTEDAWLTVLSRRQKKKQFKQAFPRGAVIDACQRTFNGNDFLLRVHPGSYIAMLSTPSVEVASRLRGISQLKFRGRIHAFNAYVADPEGVLRGIVHGIPAGTSQDDLMENLVFGLKG
ncbi:hypothetical protein HPB51_008716 [Rhipicephalus microplus]|uniref:Uncharacterized protein n=1 Tax=Rhipicephalus microplus TaxID=6941 RepID=A0A9J6F0N0_RHIMP|nr:hypothetical protein HPB51_008716 [Rhipicephalus microplus]